MAETQVHVHVKPNEEHYGTSKYIKVNRITGEELPLPVQTGTLKYTGGSLSPTWENYDKEKMTAYDYNGVDAGTYTAKFVLKKGFYWEDGTITPKEINWVIEKADGYVNISNDTINVRRNKTNTIDIINSSGALSIGTYDTDKMVVTMDNNQISVKGLKAGEYSFNLEVASTTNYASTTKTINVMVTSEGEIYGVRFNVSRYITMSGKRTEDAADFSEAQFYQSTASPTDRYRSRTPSSPFNEISPWKDMEIIEDSRYGTLVKIPKFYYRLLVDDGFEIQICNTKLEGFEVCPICMDRNDGQGERDFAYIGVYPSLSTNKYKSQKGVSLNSGESLTIDQMRTKIHELGKTAYLQDGTAYWTLMYLYLVEVGMMFPGYSLPGYQGPFGYNTGCTDNAPYHSSVDYFGKYRGIEGFSFYNLLYIDGILDCGSGNIYTILNPADNLTGDNKTLVNANYREGDNVNPIKWKLTNNPMMPIVGEGHEIYYNNGSLGSINIHNSTDQSISDPYYFRSIVPASSSGSGYTNINIASYSPQIYKCSMGRLMILPNTHEQQPGYINCINEITINSYDETKTITIDASGELLIKIRGDSSNTHICNVINYTYQNGVLKISKPAGPGILYIDLTAQENDEYEEFSKTITVHCNVPGIKQNDNRIELYVGEQASTEKFFDTFMGSKTYQASRTPSGKSLVSVSKSCLTVQGVVEESFNATVTNTKSGDNAVWSVNVKNKLVEQYSKNYPDFMCSHITSNQSDYRKDLFYPNNTWNVRLSEGCSPMPGGTLSTWWDLVILFGEDEYSGINLIITSSDTSIIRFIESGPYPGYVLIDSYNTKMNSFKGNTPYQGYYSKNIKPYFIKTGECYINISNSNNTLLKQIKCIITN